MGFIFSVLFFYKAYKIYLMKKNKITEIEIGDEIVKLYNNKKLVFESSKEKLLFMELENGLIKMEFEKKILFYLNFGINKSEIKILIGESFFVKMENGSFFSLSSVLDILDILRWEFFVIFLLFKQIVLMVVSAVFNKEYDKVDL